MHGTNANDEGQGQTRTTATVRNARGSGAAGHHDIVPCPVLVKRCGCVILTAARPQVPSLRRRKLLVAEVLHQCLEETLSVSGCGISVRIRT